MISTHWTRRSRIRRGGTRSRPVTARCRSTTSSRSNLAARRSLQFFALTPPEKSVVPAEFAHSGRSRRRSWLPEGSGAAVDHARSVASPPVISQQRLPVSIVTSHRFPIAEALQSYICKNMAVRPAESFLRHPGTIVRNCKKSVSAVQSAYFERFARNKRGLSIATSARGSANRIAGRDCYYRGRDPDDERIRV